MQCEHAQEFFSEYITGEIDRTLVVPLENHLGACSGCRESVDGLRKVWLTLDQMPSATPPAGFHADLMGRILAQQSQLDRELVAPRPAFRWRSIVQARSLAYAAVALILMMGVEWIQVQRAALGPLGLVLSMIRPAPLLSAQKVTWMPNGLGGGTLTVLLQAHPRVNGAETHCRYQVRVVRKDGQGDPALRDAVRTGEMDSLHPTTISLPLRVTPSDSADVVDVTLTGVDGTGDSRTITIPVAPAP